MVTEQVGEGVGFWHDVLPHGNSNSACENVPKQVQKDLKIFPVTHMDQVLEIVLLKEVFSKPPKSN